MKLFRHGPSGQEKPGVVDGDGALRDLSNHVDDLAGDALSDASLKALESVDTASLPLVSAGTRFGPCVGSVGKFICVGLNYADHAAESGMDVPPEPVLFFKATSAIIGPNDDVVIPKGSEKTDWEVELGIVLSKDASYLKDEAAAENCIAGFSIVHDISERHFQIERSGQWTKGKSCPGFTPCGPYLLSKDEVKDLANLDMFLDVNGKPMQTGNTKYMIFKPAYIIWYLSQFMLLEAGDLVSTGTPPGVGLGMNPPQYLKDGDEVELGISGLGKQKQLFKKYEE
ncbi:MAG: fumarylacetoacetate hydrolase family protein [Bacteroidota bacterium]